MIEIKLATRFWMKSSYLAIPQENAFLCHNLDLTHTHICVQVAVLRVIGSSSHEPAIFKGLTKYFSHLCEVSKGAKIRNRYNQVPHLTQDTNGKVTNSQ